MKGKKVSGALEEKKKYIYYAIGQVNCLFWSIQVDLAIPLLNKELDVHLKITLKY